MTLGGRVRHERERAGLSQEELGERSGLSRQHIGEIERDKKDPRFHTVARLAAALEVPIGALAGEVQPQPRRATS